MIALHYSYIEEHISFNIDIYYDICIFYNNIMRKLKIML